MLEVTVRWDTSNLFSARCWLRDRLLYVLPIWEQTMLRVLSVGKHLGIDLESKVKAHIENKLCFICMS